MIQMRLTFNNQTEKEEALKLLTESFNVIKISKDYANRDSKSFRVYVDAELKK